MNDNKIHVVALSGGKDSTALALRLAEVEPRPYLYVCTPTGNEAPELVDHWLAVSKMLGSPIIPVTGGKSLQGLIREWNALPNGLQRWCTRVLKIEPYRAFLLKQAAVAPVVSYVGLRADEEGRAGGAYGDIDGVEMRFPLREWGWGLNEVLAYLDRRGASIPERTDCDWCFWQTLGEWWVLWHDRPAVYAAAEAEEAAVTAFRGRPHTFRNPSRDTWPAALKDLRAEFEKGRIPPRTKVQHDLLQRGGTCRVCTM